MLCIYIDIVNKIVQCTLCTVYSAMYTVYCAIYDSMYTSKAVL